MVDRPPKKRPAPVPRLEGTTWVGVDGPQGLPITFRFEKNGLLVYRYLGTTYRNGTWKQEGRAVHFEMNHKFRETQEVLKGDVLEGDS